MEFSYSGVRALYVSGWTTGGGGTIACRPQRFGSSTRRVHDTTYNLYLIWRQFTELARTATNVDTWRVRVSSSGAKLTDVRYERNTEGMASWRGRNARRSTSDAWRLKLC